MPGSLSILMIAPQFRPLIGGYERAAERLSLELVRQGHEVTVIAERRDRRWLDTEFLHGLKIRRLWCVYRPGLHMLTSLASYACYMIWRRSEYDLIHVHQYGSHAALAVALGGLLKKPVVLKLTSTSREGIGSNQAGRTWKDRVVTALLRKVDLCIAPTGLAENEAIRFGIAAERIAVIPNGIDITVYKPCEATERERLRARLGLTTEQTALYMGRLSYAKNPEGLIDAWATLHANMPDARLLIVGDGPLRASVERRIQRYQLGDVITLVGEQVNTPEWYAVADMFVLPSHYEGLSNSLIEAMSCGLPVVSTRVSGSTEILEACDAGELVEINDMEGLASAMSRMLGDPARSRQRGDVARRYVEHRMAVTTVASDMVERYWSLLDVSPWSSE